MKCLPRVTSTPSELVRVIWGEAIVEVEMDRIVTSSKSQIVQSSSRRDSGCRSSVRGLCDDEIQFGDG